MSTLEDSRPDATDMTCSQRKKRKKNKNRSALGKNGVDIHSNNADVAVECNATQVSDAEGLKSTCVEKKTVARAVINSCLKSKDDTVELREGIDVKANETVSETQSPKSKKTKRKKSEIMKVCDLQGNSLATSMKSGLVGCMLDDSNKETIGISDGNAGQNLMCNLASKRENSVTGEEIGFQNLGKAKEKKIDGKTEVNLDPLGAEGVSDAGRKRRKKKRNGKKNIEALATIDNESVQCFLDHSNREAVENCDGNADGECASKDLASKIEDSVTGEKGVQNIESTKKNKKGQKAEVDQDHLGAEGVSNVEMKTKKRKKKIKKKKSCEDHETDNMEGKKDDVSISINDEVPELGRVKLESSVQMPINVAERVASKETKDARTCTCKGQSTKKLLVFDLNGILADIAKGHTGQFVPDGKISHRSVFKRPFVADFLDFCFERFDVGIWSSRHIGLDFMIDLVMRNHARNLLFCFDQSICTTTKFKDQKICSKPLFLKDLRKVWDRFGTCLTCGKRKYDETNTLLVDDSPQKALCNPPHSGIFPVPYEYKDREDSGLGPDSELRKYLERLAKAENVQKFVEENPFGQPAITETHESWQYYSKIIEKYK